MAEVVGAIGLAASIASFVDYGTRVASRVREIKESADNTPAAFEDVSVQLPVLLNVIHDLQKRTALNASLSIDAQVSF